MQMKNRKRFLALVAAAAMVIAPSSAFATNVTNGAIDGVGGQGSGTTEGWLDKEYFKVEYPTIADGELDFIMDPQELIKNTSGTDKMHGAETFEPNQTLFFKTDGATNWTHTSKAYEVKIWSTSVVDVSVSAKVSAGAIEISTDSAFTANEKPSIYMAVEKETSTPNNYAVGAVVDPSKQVGTMNVTTAALDIDNDFEIKVATGSYIFALKDSAVAKTVKFRLSGSANKNANWKDVVDVEPTVDLVWSVKPQSGAQVVSASNDPVKWANRAQSYSLKVDLSAAGGASIKDVGVNYNGKVHTYNGTWTGGTKALQVNSWAEISGDTITLNPGLSQYLPSGSKLFVKLLTADGADKVLQLVAE